MWRQHLETEKGAKGVLDGGLREMKMSRIQVRSEIEQGLVGNKA